MKQGKNNEIVNKISCHIISIMIILNMLQIVLGWNFKIGFSMWIEYAFISVLFIINKFKIVNIRNVVAIVIIILTFALNRVFNDSSTIKEYVNKFMLFALPQLLIFMFKIDLKYFVKIFYGYNIVNVILYLLVFITNPDILVEGYMTFGFNSIFSLVYILVYSYYNNKRTILVLSIILLPIIFINGNRGTILISSVAIILMILMNTNNIKKKIFFIIVVITFALSIMNITKICLDFVTQKLEINTYSVKNLYNVIENSNKQDVIGGRYKIYEEAMNEFDKHTLLGMGIASFENTYGYFPHNIIIDVLVTFGILFGIPLLIYLLYFTYRLINYSQKIEEKIIVIFLISNLMKLMLSRTFIIDPTFWLYVSLGNYIIMENLIKIKNKAINE